METNLNQDNTRRERRRLDASAVPAITPASAKRSPQLQVSDADVVRELVQRGHPA